MPYMKETTRHHARDIKRKEKIKKAKEQRLQRKLRKESGAPAGIPQTLETLRTADETVFQKDDPDLLAEEKADEVNSIFTGERSPKLLLTFSDRCCPRTVGFCKELVKVLPNVHLAARWHLPLKKIIPKAIQHDFTALLVVNEDAKQANTLVVSHLPSGPTVTFRLSNVRLRREMRASSRQQRRSRAIEPGVIPCLVTTRFSTRLGRRVERLLSGLFPEQSRQPVPELHSRTVVFHNQRDFIFFRHYRYQHRVSVLKSSSAEADSQKASESTAPLATKESVAMNEVGPRFTLKLKSIQLGVFDSIYGDYEWVRKSAELGRSRRTFLL